MVSCKLGVLEVSMTPFHCHGNNLNAMTPDTTNLLPVQYSTTATEINIAVIIGLLKAVIIITIMC